VNFQEGSSALLFTGYVECGDSGKCGVDEWTIATITWTSVDGRSWRPETAMPDPYQDISGGSSGFISLKGSTLWTSSDGQSWRQGTIPSAALETGASVSNPVSFAGGFVLPGVVIAKKGHTTPSSNGCTAGGGTDLTKYQAALWWSPDGTTWTRDVLGGTTSSYSGVSIDVTRIDDHTIVAQAYVGNSEYELASSDGKTWKRLKGNPIDPNSDGGVVVGRARGLITALSSDENQYVPDFYDFDASFNLVSVKQTGDLPWDGGQLALGPTGLLVTNNGTAFWIGVPTAG
jgi:hypothetical protein